jgi:hypothetical protein
MKRPSPAIVISLVALFTSMSGTSFAVTRYLITKESQIAPAVIRKLQEHTFSTSASTTAVAGPVGPAGVGIEGREGRASTVAGPAGAASQVPGPEGKASTIAGPRGETGAEGHIASMLREVEATDHVAAGVYESVEAHCAEGERALGGGYETLEAEGAPPWEVKVLDPRIAAGDTDYELSVDPGQGAWRIKVFAVCAAP